MIDQAEFHGFPASQIESAPEAVVQRFQRLSEERGPLFPQCLLHRALGVSQQRAAQLVQGDRFHVIEVDGTKFVPLFEVQSFHRKPGGRPKKEAA